MPTPSEGRAQVFFRDPERAAHNLDRISERVSAGVMSALNALLPEAPDPDAALNLFERLVEDASHELLRMLDRHRFLVHYALVVFGYSLYLGETLIQNPDLFQAFLREKSLDRIHSIEEFRESFARFRSRSFETDFAVLLGRFKRREYVRIMLRDVLGIATLAETTAEISALSDVLITEALRAAESALRARYGWPQILDRDARLLDAPFAVLSLGKLGGNELNYSSDIDLLFLYGDGDEAGTLTISNREFFIRLGQQITETLSRVTREGSVFRIDLRLRPQGREGEPAVGLRHALRYYAGAAHDWELQAMIKVRYSAGDLMLAREFIRSVQPFVYTERLNFAAIETALNAAEKIRSRRRTAKALGENSMDVKLDRGGIRDIEFLVQCLQRVYGGAEPWLRSGGTLFSLQKLHDKGHISGKDFHELTTAYEFLRAIEHRLQTRHGQQTHRLPQSPAELQIIARAVGDDSQDIIAALRRRMQAVAEIYDRIIHRQQVHQQQDTSDFQLHSVAGESGRDQSYNQILQQLAVDAPEVYEIARRPTLDARARRNLNRFLSAAFTSSERYAAVVEWPHAVDRALQLFATSDYLTDILVRHPEEIATVRELAQGSESEPEPSGAGELFVATDSAAAGLADPVFHYLARAEVDAREKLSLLRRHYRHRVFASGARDILEPRCVYDSLAETTAAADDAIRAAFSVAGNLPGFAVLALGRLGTNEFDLLSDADLLFVHDGASDASARRAAEAIMNALAAYTRDGTVFPVDTRLRPRGGQGELVLTPSQLRAYFEQEAQAWEALTYAKLRLVAGSEEVGTRAVEGVRVLTERFATDPGFATAIRDMRRKLEEKTDPGERNIKTSAGALYDIDFIVGYLVVRRQLPCFHGNLRERVRALQQQGLFEPATADALQAAAELLRTAEHAIRLVLGRARKSLPVPGHARDATEALVANTLGRRFPQGLEAELERVFAGVREIFNRVLM